MRTIVTLDGGCLMVTSRNHTPARVPQDRGPTGTVTHPPSLRYPGCVGTMRKSLSKKLRFSILHRDNFTCRYCGRKPPAVELHVDHIIAVAKGGLNDPANLTTACTECNFGKRDGDWFPSPKFAEGSEDPWEINPPPRIVYAHPTRAAGTVPMDPDLEAGLMLAVQRAHEKAVRRSFCDVRARLTDAFLATEDRVLDLLDQEREAVKYGR